MVIMHENQSMASTRTVGSSRPGTPPIGAWWSIGVTAAARLSFTLIDMNGEGGRRNGVASLSLKDPSLRAVLTPARRFSLSADENASAHLSVIQPFLRKLQQRWRGPSVKIEIEQGLPAHAGFGSKTTTLLALGKAYAVLCGRDHSNTEEVARVGHRVSSAGGSVNLIDRGGFIVDGGQANPANFDAEPRRYLLPSRFAAADKRPPVLIHSRFPPWPILVIRCHGTGLHGNAELDFFQRTLPVPAAEARRTAHVVLMGLAPAIVEADYPAFCRSVNTLTFETYFKQRQIETQSAAVQALIRDAARRSDIDAIGMSSLGPMCFAFTRDPTSAIAWLEGLREARVVHSFWFTAAQNHPAIVQALPTWPGDRRRL
jgi:beta-ribofuranosylaminobenzene 5'-phosphate synthase